jgi:hypothetical protein
MVMTLPKHHKGETPTLTFLQHYKIRVVRLVPCSTTGEIVLKEGTGRKMNAIICHDRMGKNVKVQGSIVPEKPSRKEHLAN